MKAFSVWQGLILLFPLSIHFYTHWYAFSYNHWYFKTIRQLEEIKPVGGNTQIHHCIGYVKSPTASRKSFKVAGIIWDMMMLWHMDIHNSIKSFWCQMLEWLAGAVCICRSIFWSDQLCIPSYTHGRVRPHPLIH